ncbi:MAG: beta strand repeat-containing protein, partial [Pyrinomonadaceae bacterium]
MESTPTLRFSLQRLFLLTLVSFVAVAAMLGIAASANKANRAAKAQARQAEQAANSKSAINPLVQNGKQQQAPTLAAITATLTDNVTLATKVVPGGTINYTAVITNTAAAGAGNEATNVTYNAPLDANETLVAGSIHASPVAIDNAYTTVGNTLLEAGVAASGNPAVTSAVTLFTNDTISTPPDTIVLASFTAASANGGTVSVNADGSFTYLPPVGFTGNDTFTYTIRNSADASLTNTGTVTVTVGAPRVWYVNNSGANGDGRSTSPFNTLANAAAVDGANDIIYIFTGAGNYTGGITLTNGEQVTGNGVALVVNTFTLRAAGSRPTVVNGAGNGLTLALGNTLSGFNFGNCTGGVAVTGTSVGTLTMNNMLINTNGGALDLTGVATPTVSVVLDSTTSSSGTKNVNLVGLNGTITLGSGALSGASGNAFDVSGAGNAVITYSGTIGNTTARSVNVVNKNGGSVSLSGAVSGSNLGIVLTGNTGSTINFSGGINLSTGANPAFTATGGGTVTATQDNNTIVNTLVTTTGTALNVANTTIGASGVTFRSISSNGGTASGIILNTTGSSGGLTVTGDGINTTKGGNASGGTIANKDDGGTDNSGTVGTGIFLNSTSNVVLRRMQLNDHKNYAIRGLSVTGFTLQYTTINGLNGDTTLGEESNVAFGITNPSGSNGLLGSGLIDNVKISGGVENNMEFYNQSGTLNALTISNSDIKSNTVATGNDGILIESQTSASMTVSVQTCVFDDNKSQAVQFNALDSSTGDITVNSSTLLRTTQGNEGFVFQNASNAHLTAHITNNTSTGIGGVVAFVGNTAGNASATSLLTAVISGNNITHPTTALNSAIIAFLSSTVGQVAPSNIKIDSNTVAENSTGGVSRGIFVDTPDTSTTPSFTATVTSNTVSVGDNVAGLQGIGLQARRGTGCFRVSSNTVTFPNGTPAGVFGIRLRQVSPGVANLEQGAAAGTAAARLAANNPGSTTEVIGTVTVVANGTCLTAPTLPQPEDQTAALSESAVNPPSTALNRQPPQFTGITGSAIGLGSADNSVESATTATSREARIASNPILTRQNEVSSNSSVAATSVQAVSSKVGNSSVMAKATPRFTAAEVARIYRSEAPLSHHAIRSNLKLASQDQNAPASGENVTMNTVPTLPGGSKSITIKYSATVNSPPLARSVQTQGTVTFTGGPGSPLLTTDPETGTAVPTKTNINALMTWNGVTSTDWNTATNWTPPAGGTQYAPGVSNPAVNDVVIPNVGNQPTIGTTDIGIFSLNISNGRTLTITNPRILTIGGSPGGDLTLDGIISGGFLNLGTGTHVIT